MTSREKGQLAHEQRPDGTLGERAECEADAPPDERGQQFDTGLQENAVRR
ncbi:hypothetical protein OIU91_38410 [Streptomyces sp. NBC_01456]|nr:MULTISPECIES: hypothetical protein [unclassified Streptomyces]